MGLDEGSLEQLREGDRKGERIKRRSDCNRMRPLPINAEESKSTKNDGVWEKGVEERWEALRQSKPGFGFGGRMVSGQRRMKGSGRGANQEGGLAWCLDETARVAGGARRAREMR